MERWLFWLVLSSLFLNLKCHLRDSVCSPVPSSSVPSSSVTSSSVPSSSVPSSSVPSSSVTSSSVTSSSVTSSSVTSSSVPSSLVTSSSVPSSSVTSSSVPSSSVPSSSVPSSSVPSSSVTSSSVTSSSVPSSSVTSSSVTSSSVPSSSVTSSSVPSSSVTSSSVTSSSVPSSLVTSSSVPSSSVPSSSVTSSSVPSSLVTSSSVTSSSVTSSSVPSSSVPSSSVPSSSVTSSSVPSSLVTSSSVPSSSVPSSSVPSSSVPSSSVTSSSVPSSLVTSSSVPSSSVPSSSVPSSSVTSSSVPSSLVTSSSVPSSSVTSSSVTSSSVTSSSGSSSSESDSSEIQNTEYRIQNTEAGNRHKTIRTQREWSTQHCMQDVDIILKKGNLSNAIEAIKTLERVLEDTEVNGTMSMSVSRFVAVLHKHRGPFTGLDIYASEKEARIESFDNPKVKVRLPRELNAGSENTIVFCMFTWPEANGMIWGAGGELYECRLFGVSVRGKVVTGLQECVTIRVKVAANESYEPTCVFLDVTTNQYSSDGCRTVRDPDQSHVTCCCNHLTYFGVLMVSSPPSPRDQQILTYISLIGCGLSLFALLITVALFIVKREVRADVSMKVHFNLAIALILLNVHFLPSQRVAALPSTWLCFYIALVLHYSLLATFSWMAVEGFHLYLLLVRVFNIYIRRYMLKLSLVGWVFPAVIVSLVVIIDKDAYGRVPLDSSNPNSTEICYIGNNTVKVVTTLGVFCLVFLFNVTILGVTVKHVVALRQRKEFGQNDRNRLKRDICTLLGVTTLLGITWGLVFFSFGSLTTVGLYLFCILNPLQGFFIFLWFVMSLRKTGDQAAKISSVSRSTNS